MSKTITTSLVLVLGFALALFMYLALSVKTNSPCAPGWHRVDTGSVSYCAKG